MNYLYKELVLNQVEMVIDSRRYDMSLMSIFL